LAVVPQEFMEVKGAEGSTVAADKLALARVEVRDLCISSPLW
jgi:hypothetical protein